MIREASHFRISNMIQVCFELKKEYVLENNFEKSLKFCMNSNDIWQGGSF
jgi:hypothetical protein